MTFQDNEPAQLIISSALYTKVRTYLEMTKFKITDFGKQKFKIGHFGNTDVISYSIYVLIFGDLQLYKQKIFTEE